MHLEQNKNRKKKKVSKMMIPRGKMTWWHKDMKVRVYDWLIYLSLRWALGD